MVAAFFFTAGWILLLSYNEMGSIFFGIGLVCVVIAFREYLVAATALVVAAVCGIGIWATLDSDAETFTVIPWVIICSAALAAAVHNIWRHNTTRRTPDAEHSSSK